MPPAMPKPPTLNAPPPSHAKVALVAAAPESPEIAAPVEALANAPTEP
ncbi:hypothetical protein AC519_4373 [Pseudomonas savastanoi]|nr:hypothetical protein AC519_4373 [Pseudomonas savastanoi]